MQYKYAIQENCITLFFIASNIHETEGHFRLCRQQQ